MRAKLQERAEAQRRRRELGTPMKQIAAQLGVSVSSVSLWTADIEITEEHRRRNLRRSNAARAAGCAETHRLRRRRYQQEGRARARLGHDPLHLAGCMLYWAEGAKGRNVVCLCNADPHMLRFFRRFLTESLGVPLSDFSIRLNVYLGNGLRIDEIERHWLDVLELPRASLRKHSINSFPTSSSGRKRNKLPYGVCTVKVHSTRVVQHIFGAIQEYADFEEPRWLE
jgi:hypothetical protein